MLQMSQLLGQAQQQAQASLEALQEQMQNELDRKYSSSSHDVPAASLCVPPLHITQDVVEQNGKMCNRYCKQSSSNRLR